jgi:glycine dehydrogenase subunit 1
MSFVPHSIEERKYLLDAVGVKEEEELFSSIPKDLRLKQSLRIPGPLDEETIKRIPQAGSARVLFAGGGLYRHHVPAVVDALSSRQEVYTAYTPYQPEISQGTLQTIFEYQSMIADLTGMDVANASMYDGATALAEAAIMAIKTKNIKRILVSRATNPSYRKVMRTYLANFDVSIEEIPFLPDSGMLDLDMLEEKAAKDAAIFVQSPNYFGIIEPLESISAIKEKAGFFGIVTGDAVSLGLIKKPGEYGCDCVVGEAQSFGNYISAGGPLLGFFCVRKENVRRIPGRIVGLSKDAEENDAFCLTLSTREQHIRREKATSNICSNQALCATRAAIYLSALGPSGLRSVALQSANGARQLLDMLKKAGYSPVFNGPFFNEFVIRMNSGTVSRLENEGIVPGIPLDRDYPEIDDALLVAVTEMNTKEEMKCLIENL